MKKSFIMLALCLPVSMAVVFAVSAKATTLSCIDYVTNTTEWVQSTTGTQPAMKENKMYWLKLDNQAGLWSSTDGKKWEKAKEDAWADKEGHWLKIHEKKLVWSTNGKAWTEVPEWKWMGADGKWYKFDSNWKLWVNS